MNTSQFERDSRPLPTEEMVAEVVEGWWCSRWESDGSSVISCFNFAWSLEQGPACLLKLTFNWFHGGFLDHESVKVGRHTNRFCMFG